MSHSTIQDLCSHLIENEEWFEVYGITSKLPIRGFVYAKDFEWFSLPIDIIPTLLSKSIDVSYILKGAVSPDRTMIMWSSFMVGRAYLEESVMDFLLFMRCSNLLRDTGSSLNTMETLILAYIRPERFFEDVARFFCDLKIPPMPLKQETHKLWQPLPRRSKLSKSSKNWPD